MVTAFKAKIFGRVQGVGYRFFAQDKAYGYSISGYAKNLYDGTVEVYAEGDRAVLEKYLTDLKRGPSLARVDRVEVDWHETEKKYDTFRIEF